MVRIRLELMKTYKMLGGAVSADLEPMPKSQLAILLAQGHNQPDMQTTAIFTCLNDFLK